MNDQTMQQNAECRVLDLEQQLDMAKSELAICEDRNRLLQKQLVDNDYAYKALAAECDKLRNQPQSLEALVIQALGCEAIQVAVEAQVIAMVEQKLSDFAIKTQIEQQVEEAVEREVQSMVENYDYTNLVENALETAIDDALQNVRITFR